MYKLLIVDDEILEREGLRDAIGWKDFGIERVECAENGQKALEMYPGYTPDIIITDIRMPFMDGLELTKNIREMDPSAVVILLSAYSEFKYAQEAIRTGVFDYILKPVEIDLLQDIIQRAVQFKLDAQEQMKKAIPVLSDEDYKNYRVDIYKNYLQLEEDLSKAVKRADGALATQFFQGIWTEFSDNQCSVDFIKRWGVELITLLTKAIIEVGENAEFIFSKADPVKQITDLQSKDNLYDYMKNIILETCQYIAANKSFKNKKLIDDVLKFVHAHYSDRSITLNKIAESIYVTPNYLSTLFKIEVGQGFSDYLTMYRIAKAKVLLKDLSLKIYDISDRVGYSDPHYFSKIFKIITGMTPKEYRDKIL